MSKNVVVVGAQWGDEGKGKIVDWLTESVQGVVRFNGGHNAGHTLVINGQKTVLRLIPSGVMHPHVKCYIGNGAVVSPEAMLKEIDDLKAHGMDAEDRIFVSGQCPLVLPYHIALDHARENALGDKKIGTTGRGIGPAYEDKIARRAVHVRDLAEPKVFAEKVRENCKLINFLLVNYYNSEPVDVEKMIEDTLAMAPRIVPKIRDISHILNTKMKEGEQFLYEGAQGTMLDIDHGTYPFVTSSNTVAGFASPGSGVGPQKLNYILGITKAYCTRVGSGPFPTELFDEVGKTIAKKGNEFGAVTGRPRRCGWADGVLLRFSAMFNGFDEMAMTNLDGYDKCPEIKICTGYDLDGEILAYPPATVDEWERCKPVYETVPGWMQDISACRSWEEIPENARKFVKRMSELIGCPVTTVGVGPDREQTIAVK